MSDQVFTDKRFIRALDCWLAKSDQSCGTTLYQFRTRIPSMFTRVSNVTLYRGMVVPQDFIDKASTSSGLILTGFTSWSKDKAIAEKFTTDKSLKTTNNTGIRILLTLRSSMQFNPIDLESICLFAGFDMIGNGLDDLSYDSALKEKEVLLKDVKVTKGMIKKL